MKFRRRVREPVDINLAPLIDVVFILLLFFVVSTSFTRETQLQLDLPESASAATAETEEPGTLEIMISVEGHFRVDGQTLQDQRLQTLMDTLQQVSAGDNSRPLVISADAKAPYQAVVTAMDAAGKLGFARLRISTRELEQP